MKSFHLKGQHIVFVTGEEYYRSEEGMSMIAKILARHHGYRCMEHFFVCGPPEPP